MAKSSKRSRGKNNSLPPAKRFDNTMGWMTTSRSCCAVSVRRISFGTILMVELL